MKSKIAIITTLIILTVSCSGCLDWFMDDTIRYEVQPVSIEYTIRYGYTVTVTGTGSYDIHYLCDIPEVLLGSVSSPLFLHTTDYTLHTLENNQIIQWDITRDEAIDYTLGIQTTVSAQTFYVATLDGSQALTLAEIQTQYPDYITQYGQPQSNNSIIYIDPDNLQIKTIAHSIQTQAATTNAFKLAKEAFLWLKQNTRYQIHTFDDSSVQPAAVTCTEKTGDCDDLSFLYVSLCRALEIPARFIRGYLIEEENNVVTATPHAWAEVFVGGPYGTTGWIPVECAGASNNVDVQIYQNFGIEDVQHLRLFEDAGTNASLALSLTSISWVRYNPSVEITAIPFADVTNYTVVQSKSLVIDGTQRSYQ
jgi:hypothetical protein